MNSEDVKEEKVFNEEILKPRIGSFLKRIFLPGEDGWDNKKVIGLSKEVVKRLLKESNCLKKEDLIPAVSFDWLNYHWSFLKNYKEDITSLIPDARKQSNIGLLYNLKKRNLQNNLEKNKAWDDYVYKWLKERGFDKDCNCEMCNFLRNNISKLEQMKEKKEEKKE